MTLSERTTLHEPTRAEIVPARLPDIDRAALIEAWGRLERPSFAMRASRLLGKPLDAGFRRLPQDLRTRLAAVTERALEEALDRVVASLDPLPPSPARNRLACVGLGAAGGLFGPVGLIVELPITTVMLLRTIAGVARSEGEDLDDMESRLACLEVLALTGPRPWDDTNEPGFFELKSTFAAQMGMPGALSSGALSVPVAAQLVQALARRFGVVVTQKAAARAVPLVGAATGAGLNAVFFDHYLDAARGHFTRRRLERRHGRLLVEEEYVRIGEEQAALSRARTRAATG